MTTQTELAAEVERLKDQNSKYHRRAQQAESAVLKFKKQWEKHGGPRGGSFGRSLLSSHCTILQSKLDLMRDEFIRIGACPGCTSEIKGITERATADIEYHVPVTLERDKLERENNSLKTLLEEAVRALEQYGWHNPACPMPANKCDCGLEQTLTHIRQSKVIASEKRCYCGAVMRSEGNATWTCTAWENDPDAHPRESASAMGGGTAT